MSNPDNEDTSDASSSRVIDVELVIPVTIAVLTTIFVGSLVAVFIVCKRRYCRPNYVDFYVTTQPHNRVDSNLVENMECCQQDEDVQQHLQQQQQCDDDVTAAANDEVNEISGFSNSNLDLLLQDEVWVNDATGLAPHCLAILKTVHQLTERLVGVTLMATRQQMTSPPETVLTQLVAVAQRIGPRVDDVVHSLYPPLDPRLLEARCSALVLSVNHLVLLTKNVARLTTLLDWVDQSLADVDDHLQELRTASVAYELTCHQTLKSAASSRVNVTVQDSPEDRFVCLGLPGRSADQTTVHFHQSSAK